jgi:hypothetical protein
MAHRRKALPRIRIKTDTRTNWKDQYFDFSTHAQGRIELLELRGLFLTLPIQFHQVLSHSARVSTAVMLSGQLLSRAGENAKIGEKEALRSRGFDTLSKEARGRGRFCLFLTRLIFFQSCSSFE